MTPTQHDAQTGGDTAYSAREQGPTRSVSRAPGGRAPQPRWAATAQP